jgi:hypothetical protein
MRPQTATTGLQPPDPMKTQEEHDRALNQDLTRLTLSQLEFEIWRTARIAERHGDRLIFLPGRRPVRVREWADARVGIIRELVTPPATSAPASPAPRGRGGPKWVL